MDTSEQASVQNEEVPNQCICCIARIVGFHLAQSEAKASKFLHISMDVNCLMDKSQLLASSSSAAVAVVARLPSAAAVLAVAVVAQWLPSATAVPS